MKEFLKNNLKTIIIILIVFLLFLYYSFNTGSDDYVSMSPMEKMQFEINNLKDENNLLEEQLQQANSQLEELQKNYQNDEDLIELLQDQLLSNGIEPAEL